MDVVHSGRFGRGLVDYGLQLLNSREHAVVLYLSHPAGSLAFIDDILEMGQAAASSGPGTNAQQPVPANWRAMDPRLYGIGAQILRSLGVRQMKTHVSTPRSLKGLSGFGLEIVDSEVISS
jgi:3,4-dihydroxy 2-butanone 4-phosphate synthase/GTP cyclohydrolase II